MKVSNIMTKNPVALRQSDSVRKLLKVLKNHKFSGCPVVDGKGRMIGIITHTDVLRLIDVHSRVQTGNLHSLILAIIKSENYDRIKSALRKVTDMKLSSLMSKKIISVEVNDDIYKAAKLMNRYDIERLPVTKKGKLVGIISRWDIINALEKL